MYMSWFLHTAGSAPTTGADGVIVRPQLSVTAGGVGATASAGQATVDDPVCRKSKCWCTDGISIDPCLCYSCTISISICICLGSCT